MSHPGVRVGLLAATFTTTGLTFAATMVRLPDLRDVADLDYATLGFVLLCPALGGLAAVPAATWIATRIGALRGIGALLPAWAGAGIVIPLSAHDATLLAAAMLAWGFLFAAIDTIANIDVTELDRGRRTPVMSRLHGCYSAGAILGALGGAAAAQAGTPLVLYFVLTGVPAFAVASNMLVLSIVVPRSAPTDAAGTRLLSVVSRWWPLVLVALIALMAEGAVADWSATHLTDIGAEPLLAGLGFAAFSATMLLGRLAGDQVSRTFGKAGTIRIGGTVAVLAGGSGLVLAHVTAQPTAAIAGFAGLGLGLSAVLPAAIDLAAERAEHLAPADSAAAPAAVAAGGYVGVLIGPPVVGAAAHVMDLSWALLLLPALLTIVILLPSLLAWTARTGTPAAAPGAPGGELDFAGTLLVVLHPPAETDRWALTPPARDERPPAPRSPRPDRLTIINVTGVSP